MRPRARDDIAGSPPAAEGTIARAAATLSHWAARTSTARLAVFAALVALALSLPGFFSIPPVDRDEARFAQATKQMMETGDFVDIRLQDEARHKKPVGIYWLQAAAAGASGQGSEAPIWVYRLPSLFGIALAVGLSVVLAATFLGGPRALLAGLLVGAAILPGVEARLAKTDAVLLATIIAFHIAIARAWLWRHARQTPSRTLTVAAWAAIGLGILVKGPIAPLVCGLTVLALSLTSRSWRWIGGLRPVMGLIVAAAIALPWYVLIGVRTDGAFFLASAGADLLAKVGSGQESHGAPPGVHLLAMLGTFWPLSALALLALPRLRDHVSEPPVLFGLCWIVPTWLVFELTPTKLPHYVLPILPAVALVTVAALRGEIDAPRWLRRTAKALLAIVPTALAASLIAAGFYLTSLTILFGAALVAAGAVLAWLGRDRTAAQWSLRGVVVAALVYLGTYPFGLAAFQPVWIGPALAEAVDAIDGCEDPAILLAGFREPSAVFLLGTGTRLLDGAEAATQLRAEPCAIAIVEARQLEAFASRSGPTVEHARVEGLNLNGGDAMRFGLFTAAR